MTATPTMTPTTAIVCGARVDYNVNMRLLPEPDAEVLVVIPYETVVEISGQTEAGDWWFTRYEDQWGWLDGEFISLDTDCARAPVLTP